MHNQKISDFIESSFAEYSDKILLADGFDKAFIGIGKNFNGNPVAVYSIEKCINILVKQFEDEDDPKVDAVDFLESKVMGLDLGEFTPMFINTLA